jgi:hypothetical protein
MEYLDEMPKFHSAVSVKDRNDQVLAMDAATENTINEFFLLYDEENIYAFNKRTREMRIFLAQRISGVFFSDYNYLYTLSKERGEGTVPSSFRLYDTWNCITS